MSKQTCFLIWIVLMSFACCTKQEVRLTRVELKLVDSLYRQQRDLLIPHLDDSCKTIREKRLQTLMDSIKEVRIEDIHEMIKQYE